jgi:hypothetical protein
MWGGTKRESGRHLVGAAAVDAEAGEGVHILHRWGSPLSLRAPAKRRSGRGQGFIVEGWFPSVQSFVCGLYWTAAGPNNKHRPVTCSA